MEVFLGLQKKRKTPPKRDPLDVVVRLQESDLLAMLKLAGTFASQDHPVVPKALEISVRKESGEGKTVVEFNTNLAVPCNFRISWAWTEPMPGVPWEIALEWEVDTHEGPKHWTTQPFQPAVICSGGQGASLMFLSRVPDFVRRLNDIHHYCILCSEGMMWANECKPPKPQRKPRIKK